MATKSLSRLLLLGLCTAPWLQWTSPVLAEPSGCAEAGSTVEMSRCMSRELETVDRKLEAALAEVAREAAAVPGGTFQPLWRENLTEFFGTSADPAQQAEAFRHERRKVCAYVKSMAFQGTGFGLFIASCEIAVTKALLEQFDP